MEAPTRRAESFTSQVQEEGRETRVLLGGALTFQDAGRLRRLLESHLALGRRLVVDLDGVERVDGGAGAVLAELWDEARCAGHSLELRGGETSARAVLDLYLARPLRDCLQEEPAPPGALEQIGDSTVEIGLTLRGMLDFLGKLLVGVRRGFTSPASVRWRDVPALLERHGADGLPIVVAITFLVGLITAFQAATQLHQFGADTFVANLVGLSITRELGPLMAAIVVAGRSGAAIAAELGTMKVSEEVDALHSMGLSTTGFLVLPRAIALVVALPLLTLVADVVAVVGGAITTTSVLDVTLTGYVVATRDALDFWDVFGGLLKAVVFGALIALIACERGLATRGGAEGVGRATTSAVVTILFALIVADALFTVLYQQFGV